jgi:hypothetical protein
MTYPDLSPKAWAVLHDLEDTERHRKCQAYTWKYDAGTFECDSCGVRRRAIEQTCDNVRSIRADGISSPEAQSHKMTRPSARPADPRNGRGLVVRGSDE